MASIATQTYASRAARQPNPAAKALLETIERKQSNLCVSVDVTNKADLLEVCDAVGPDVCLVKVRIPRTSVSLHSIDSTIQSHSYPLVTDTH